jgi:hypothetical protein
MEQATRPSRKAQAAPNGGSMAAAGVEAVRARFDLELAHPNLELPPRDSGLRTGARAPDAPCHGAGRQPTRLFELFKGPHWTLLGIDVPRHTRPAPRPGLRIHTTGPEGDVRDDAGHIARAYALAPGHWVLVRPDGYIGAIVTTEYLPAMERHFAGLGEVTAAAMNGNPPA